VTLTERERFLRYMSFEPVDRISLMEMGFWAETFERWHHEGLPKWVIHERHLEAYLNLDLSFSRNGLPINPLIYPPFELKVLEETGDTQIISDENGVICRQRVHHQTIPQYIRFPVEDEIDYEALSPRLNGADQGFIRAIGM
jgi:hypothetical protein